MMVRSLCVLTLAVGVFAGTFAHTPAYSYCAPNTVSGGNRVSGCGNTVSGWGNVVSGYNNVVSGTNNQVYGSCLVVSGHGGYYTGNHCR